MQGTVSSVVFRNEENGYTVLRLQPQDGDEATVVGCLPGVAAGEGLSAVGRWTSHASYGSQFKAESFRRSLPTDEAGVFAFLASGVVRGIGMSTARRLVDEFGADALGVIEDAPELLTRIKGITRSRAQTLSEALRHQMGMRRLLDFLADCALPARLAAPLYRRFGSHALEIVNDNPYLLTDDELSVPFGTADALALGLGVEADAPLRLEAALLFELSHNLRNGHVFLPEGKLLAATAQLLELDPAALSDALDALLIRGDIVREPVAGEQAIYLAALHEAESYAAMRLAEMSHGTFLPPDGFDRMLTRIEAEQGITYAPSQREAVRLAACAQVMILTGGPGTGKTTILRGVLALFDVLRYSCVLAAPTGRAAKRLSETCGCPASTIHRLLGMQHDPNSGMLVFSHDQSDPLDADVVIIDETSMVDIVLMQALLQAMRGDCRLILVGDADQLPSVGAGNVLSDLLRSNCVPAVRLSEIFRQAQESAIVTNAHEVNRGILPNLKGGGDFFFLRRADGQAAVDTIADLCARRLPEHMGIPPHQIQVISPTRRQITGTVNLNQALQAAVNPPAEGKAEQSFGEFLYRNGDRVMQIRNNYDILWRDTATGEVGAGIFNGDIGQITAIEKGGILTIDFDGRTATYTADMLAELEPAYAITAHKAQGSEYRAVVLAALSGAPQLLTRGVLYTAITRARELLVLVGDDTVVARMVQNDRQQRRYSGLRARLTDAFAPYKPGR